MRATLALLLLLLLLFTYLLLCVCECVCMWLRPVTIYFMKRTYTCTLYSMHAHLANIQIICERTLCVCAVMREWIFSFACEILIPMALCVGLVDNENAFQNMVRTVRTVGKTVHWQSIVKIKIWRNKNYMHTHTHNLNMRCAKNHNHRNTSAQIDVRKAHCSKT